MRTPSTVVHGRSGQRHHALGLQPLLRHGGLLDDAAGLDQQQSRIVDATVTGSVPSAKNCESMGCRCPAWRSNSVGIGSGSSPVQALPRRFLACRLRCDTDVRGSRHDESDRKFIAKLTAALTPTMRAEGFVEHAADRVPLARTRVRWSKRTPWRVTNEARNGHGTRGLLWTKPARGRCVEVRNSGHDFTTSFYGEHRIAGESGTSRSFRPLTRACGRRTGCRASTLGTTAQSLRARSSRYLSRRLQRSASTPSSDSSTSMPPFNGV